MNRTQLISWMLLVLTTSIPAIETVTHDHLVEVKGNITLTSTEAVSSNHAVSTLPSPKEKTPTNDSTHVGSGKTWSDISSKYWRPLCVDDTEAYVERCLHLSYFQICPADQWLAYEIDPSSGYHLRTGNQSCLARNTEEPLATQTIDDPASGEPIQISVTQEDLQRLEVGSSKILTPYGERNLGLIGEHRQMWTDATTIQNTLEVLGQPVQVRLHPVKFHWDYGDGASNTTTHPGHEVTADYAEETNTSHRYTETGMFTVNLTVSYVGEFRAGNGSWIAIGGELNIPAEPITMDIWRVKRTPVYHDCDEDPYGYACDTIFQP